MLATQFSSLQKKLLSYTAVETLCTWQLWWRTTPEQLPVLLSYTAVETLCTWQLWWRTITGTTLV